MTDKRYAIRRHEEGQYDRYWTGPRDCWTVGLPTNDDLLTADKAAADLAYLSERLPHAAAQMKIIDIVEMKERARIYGPAFRLAMHGLIRNEENFAKAREAGNQALRDAGYEV